MVTFSKLEKKGNLGNQLFQIASTMGIAVANGQDFAFPKWSFNHYFTAKLPIITKNPEAVFYEPHFHHAPVALEGNNWDLDGWLQSEKYFDVPTTRKFLTFKPEMVSGLKARHEKLFSKPVILISVRRGDFVGHPDYFQLNSDFYITSLLEHFPDWRERNLLLLSDDANYCKFHFSFLENAFFSDGLSGIEQLALGSLCDDFIISNSTFSWWCAWLGETENSKVIRPMHNFSDAKRSSDDDRDYYPKRWIAHESKRINLPECTFYFQKPDLHLASYYNNNFSLSSEIRLSSEKNANPGTVQFTINNCVLPPLCVHEAILATTHGQSVTGILKGNFLKISKFWDLPTLEKQHDFGVFVPILNERNPPKALVLFVSQLQGEPMPSKTIVTFAGKIGGVLDIGYIFYSKKRIAIRFVKRSVRRTLKRFKS